MAGEYIKVFVDCLETWERLTDEEAGQLLRALLLYKRCGEAPPLSGGAFYTFPSEKAKIDRDADSYQKRCETNSINGAKGGRPKKTEEKPKNRMGFSETQKSQDKEKDKDKEKEKDNTPHSPPGGEGFEKFWTLYPKKIGKQAALKSWSKLKPDKQLTQRILEAVEYQKTWEQWTKENGQYIPNPATWLNQGRWDDEPPKQCRSGGFAYDYGSMEGSL